METSPEQKAYDVARKESDEAESDFNRMMDESFPVANIGAPTDQPVVVQQTGETLDAMGQIRDRRDAASKQLSEAWTALQARKARDK